MQDSHPPRAALSLSESSNIFSRRSRDADICWVDPCVTLSSCILHLSSEAGLRLLLLVSYHIPCAND